MLRYSYTANLAGRPAHILSTTIAHKMAAICARARTVCPLAVYLPVPRCWTGIRHDPHGSLTALKWQDMRRCVHYDEQGLPSLRVERPNTVFVALELGPWVFAPSALSYNFEIVREVMLRYSYTANLEDIDYNRDKMAAICARARTVCPWPYTCPSLVAGQEYGTTLMVPSQR